METIVLSQTRVSVGCRVTLEKKNELLVQAKENGFSSLSQYLEVLILKALNSEIGNIAPKRTLTDADIDTLEERLLSSFDSLKPTPVEIIDKDESLNRFLRNIALLCGYEGKEAINGFLKTIKDKKLDYTKLLEQIIDLDSVEENARVEATKNLLLVEFSKENKILLIDYLNFLLENGYAQNREVALIGIINSAFERGGFLEGAMIGDSKFAEKFKIQNKVNLKIN